ncbi:hypothetical protein BO82DRAFT_399522 [Aspergillus uvarum CBS 121591]|uniref:NAD(P)-binding protein n=1 Tax=Aspergillus uvarum CBS 121591 TaxID=1448315 RepID=A0A319CFR8_9EURO|nr:hypothetical protein BO82DRAFT_399522 [Aspergillus uvarum CBS 121591]PYH84696.1 hypothetical protein BO82DRAFT_399522 [Aspergillus uvarum CBS 121591]
MARPPGLTTHGYEIQFGTNHLGHALLIQKLLPRLQATAVEGHDIHEHPAFAGWSRYGQSKLASLLYARELARRYPELTSISLTPEVVNTGLVGKPGLLEPGVCLWAATTATAHLTNGGFYEPVGVLLSKLDSAAEDEELAKRWWDWTDEALRPFL